MQEGIVPYNFLNALFINTHATAGICTPSVDHLKDYLEKAKQYTEKAKTTRNFVAMSPVELPAQLFKASEALSQVIEKIDAIDKHLGDIRAACEISDAIMVLNSWAADPDGDNAKAAAAFDKLFGALSIYLSKLPPGINQYARIFEQIGFAKFFTNMRGLLDPENPRTPSGSAMKDAMAQ
jgi:hypothetical protein